MNEKTPEVAERSSKRNCLRMGRSSEKLARRPGAEMMGPSGGGCCCLGVEHEQFETRPPPRAVAGAAASSMSSSPSRPRHRLKTRARGNECAASVSTVVYTSALSSVQTYDVRRAGAREKVCCLPTRMVSSVLDHEVP
jgi:hypothetical protein